MCTWLAWSYLADQRDLKRDIVADEEPVGVDLGHHALHRAVVIHELLRGDDEAEVKQPQVGLAATRT